jgi:MarR family transcriptional regulator, 2-MHQ and catechol-resistance regulon repressor
MDDVADDPRIDAMGMLVEGFAALHGTLEKELDARTGLPLTWFEVLLRLRRTPEHRLRMSDLAAQVSFSTSGLTRLVDRIEAAGMIRREACPSDRRGSFAVLTPAGRQRIDDALPVHLEGLERHLASRLTADELDALTEIMRKVRDGLRPAAARRSCSTPLPS